MERVTQNGGIGVPVRSHPDAGPRPACPRPTGLAARRSAAVARERPRARACHGAPPSLRRLALRCAPRRGRLGDGCAAMAYTPLGHSLHESHGPVQESACRHTPTDRPWGAVGSMAVIRHLGGGGLCGAVRHGAGCRSGLAALALANRPGLRVPATPSVQDMAGLRTGEPPERLRRRRTGAGRPRRRSRTGCRRGPR